MKRTPTEHPDNVPRAIFVVNSTADTQHITTVVPDLEIRFNVPGKCDGIGCGVGRFVNQHVVAWYVRTTGYGDDGEGRFTSAADGTEGVFEEKRR